MASEDNSTNKPQLHLTRPQDRSVEEFKSWLLDMTERLVPGAPDTMTQEEWIEACTSFWKKVDEAAQKNSS
jgi:hypothetical protein